MKTPLKKRSPLGIPHKEKICHGPTGLLYTELAVEVLKEDYSQEGPALREEGLKSLGIPEDKPKAKSKKFPSSLF